MSTENLKSKTSGKPLEKPLVFGVRTYTIYVDQREVFKNLLETSRQYSTRSGSTIRHPDKVQLKLQIYGFNFPAHINGF